jgi:hypothetical protein
MHGRVIDSEGRILSLIKAKHRSNMDKVREEIRSSTVEELMHRYGHERYVVLDWERRYGARAKRTCCWCKRVVPAEQMHRTRAGIIGERCAECKKPPGWSDAAYAALEERNARKGKNREVQWKTGHAQRLDEEFRQIAPALLLMVRKPISKMRGYWNPYAREA